jgi:hypothetical protein
MNFLIDLCLLGLIAYQAYLLSKLEESVALMAHLMDSLNRRVKVLEKDT